MLDLPKPKAWDLAAIAAAGLGVVLCGANAALALGGQAGSSPSTSFSLSMVMAQVAVLSISLLILGKTAKEGTIWGNLAAVGGMLIGTSGILLAGAMWVAA
jgi:hypothetical protein